MYVAPGETTATRVTSPRTTPVRNIPWPPSARAGDASVRRTASFESSRSEQAKEAGPACGWAPMHVRAGGVGGCNEELRPDAAAGPQGCKHAQRVGAKPRCCGSLFDGGELARPQPRDVPHIVVVAEVESGRSGSPGPASCCRWCLGEVQHPAFAVRGLLSLLSGRVQKDAGRSRDGDEHEGRRETVVEDDAHPRAIGSATVRLEPVPVCASRSRHEPVTDAFRLRSLHSFRMSELRPALTAPVRIRGLPPRPGAGRPRRRGRPRHARADADRLRQVAHLPARGDAAADADARALAR